MPLFGLIIHRGSCVGLLLPQCEFNLSAGQGEKLVHLDARSEGRIKFHEVDLTMDTRQAAEEDYGPLKPVRCCECVK